MLQHYLSNLIWALTASCSCWLSGEEEYLGYTVVMTLRASGAEVALSSAPVKMSAMKNHEVTRGDTKQVTSISIN